MDERNQKYIAGGMGITLALVYLYFLISAIWKYVSTKDIYNSTTELIFLVMIPISILWFARKDESLMIPIMVTTGEPITTEADHHSKKSRKRFYFWDSLGLTIVFFAINTIDSIFISKESGYFPISPEWSETANIIVSHSIGFMISLVVFYAISFVWGELIIKRYSLYLILVRN